MAAHRRRPAAPALAAIVGPTGVGKTEQSLAVAERLGAEIISADSRQVYRGMDVGTAKASPDDRGRVRHHLLDLADPDQPFTLADWLRGARQAIDDVVARGRLPLIVGGTGLYVSALVEGYRLDAGQPAPEVRRRLADELAALGVTAMAARLEARSPALAARTDLRNPRRVVRALERLEAAGVGEWDGSERSEPYPGRVALIGLRRPPEVLRARIAARARAQFERGLLEETLGLLDAGYGFELPAMSGIAYREAARHLAGEWSLDDAVAATERRTWQYARRQMTWFRGMGRLVWVDLGARLADDPAAVDDVTGLIYRCLA